MKTIQVTWKVRIEDAPGCWGPWILRQTGAEIVAFIEQEDPGFRYQVQREASIVDDKESSDA